MCVCLIYWACNFIAYELVICADILGMHVDAAFDRSVLDESNLFVASASSVLMLVVVVEL